MLTLPGELSAVNGIAGAYSEHVPICHIVGMPNSTSQKNGLLLHHTLGNGDFTVYSRMSSFVSEATTTLFDPHRAAEEIDRVLRTCWLRARPVYIGLPTDIAFHRISDERLRTPLNLSLPANDAETEAEVVREIIDLMYASKNTVIIADACAIRHRVLGELHELIDATQLPTFVSPMGKGAVDESHPAFGGVYCGDVSREDVKRRVEAAELILYVGGLKSDFNSGGFTYRVERRNTVEFHSDHMKIRYSTFPGIQMNQVLRRLLDTLDPARVRTTETPVVNNVIPPGELESDGTVGKDDEITHAYLWPRIGQWLRERDVVISETGTSSFGILEARFPAHVTHISQVLYGSIGYSVGALQGAALAVSEQSSSPPQPPCRRVILFVGDGSLQLTVQEIATLIRHRLTPIIFVINNNGYTIERMIHGMDAAYNDITPWKFTRLLDVFGADPAKSKSHQVRTKAELEALLGDEQFSSCPYIQVSPPKFSSS